MHLYSNSSLIYLFCSVYLSQGMDTSFPRPPSYSELDPYPVRGSRTQVSEEEASPRVTAPPERDPSHRRSRGRASVPRPLDHYREMPRLPRHVMQAARAPRPGATPQGEGEAQGPRRGIGRGRGLLRYVSEDNARPARAEAEASLAQGPPEASRAEQASPIEDRGQCHLRRQKMMHQRQP